MEDYLKKEYNIHSSEYLEKEEEIEEYFQDNGSLFFDCGQGYSENKVEFITMIENKFYQVNLKAEIESSKQDRGDRLYWVEKITEIIWKEIEKPLPKPRTEFVFKAQLTVGEKKRIEKLLEAMKINNEYKNKE